jgi:type VI secretion system protein ImpH
VTEGGFAGSAESAVLARALTNADPRSPLAGLVEEPFRFEFFQAVRLIGQAAAGAFTDSPAFTRAPLATLPYEEHVRFRAHVGHAFPASAIASFTSPIPDDPDEPAAVPEMTVTFFGLAGTGGILPWHYTQLLIDRLREKDSGLRDFLDLFNHRLIAQFYRAWAKCHFFVGYESSPRRPPEETDRFTQMLFSLAGMGTPALRGRQTISDHLFAHYAGHFAHRPRSAVALQQIVADVFRVPTRIQQFQGQWMELRVADRTQLRAGGNNRLGTSALAGRRVWGIENKIRVRLGVLRYEQFQRFLPGGAEFIPLGQLVRSFVGPEFDFDLQLVLCRQEVPRCELGGNGGVRLGRNSWLAANRFVDDVDDAVFACEGRPDS